MNPATGTSKLVVLMLAIGDTSLPVFIVELDGAAA
jgi:hypothetical protein